MAQNIINQANVNLDSEPKASAAFQKLLPKYKALAERDLITVNADLVVVVARAKGAAQGIKALREQLAKLPDFDLGCVDELEDYCNGLHHADAIYAATVQSTDELGELEVEASATRDMFRTNLENLEHQGLIASGSLKGCQGGAGTRVFIHDIATMSAVYRANSNNIQGATCRTVAQLDRAESLCSRMVTLFGVRQLGAAGVAEVSDTRTRAFTYFVNRYNELRRGVSFLRWNQGDADQFAPSVFVIAKGKRNKDDAQTQPAQPAQPAQPPIGPNGPFIPSAPATPTPSAASATTTAQPRLAGMPGGSPFMS